jgi:5'-nucleotidase (lipoprotein e(P4) family)
MGRHLTIVGFLVLLACNASHAQDEIAVPADDRLNAIMWTMTSAEFEAASFMAFNAARVQLDAALKDKSRTAMPEQTGKFRSLPPAIIVDIDETILDNGPFQVRLMNNATVRAADLFAQWVEEADAKPLPGAVEFIKYAESKGVTIFYITNRNAEKEAATRKNLAAIGAHLPANIDTVFLEREKPEWQGDKTSRRVEAAKSHRILMLLGDDLNDFVAAQRVPADQRRASAEREAQRWGRDWIIIPNPMYGSWEGAAINFQFRASVEERRRIKRDTLNVLQD